MPNIKANCKLNAVEFNKCGEEVSRSYDTVDVSINVRHDRVGMVALDSNMTVIAANVFSIPAFVSMWHALKYSQSDPLVCVLGGYTFVNSDYRGLAMTNAVEREEGGHVSYIINFPLEMVSKTWSVLTAEYLESETLVYKGKSTYEFSEYYIGMECEDLSNVDTFEDFCKVTGGTTY